MTPRNTKQGASANARRAPAVRAARTAPSPRTRSTRPKDAQSSSALRAAPALRKVPAAPASRAQAPRAPKPARAKSDPSLAWRWWLLPLLVSAVAAIFVATYYPVAKVQYRETREKVRLEAELKGIQARNQRLQASVDRLKTPEGVEDYARSQLGLVKAGEHVVVIVDGTKPSTVATAAESAMLAPPRLDSEEAVVPPVGPWTRFLDSVFGVQ